jgi:hypothetical protein
MTKLVYCRSPCVLLNMRSKPNLSQLKLFLYIHLPVLIVNFNLVLGQIKLFVIDSSNYSLSVLNMRSKANALRLMKFV